MIRVPRQRDQQKMTKNNKHNLCCPATRWPEPEDNIFTNWLVDERTSGRTVSTKINNNEAKRLAEGRGIQNFAGTDGWCFQFAKRQGLSRRPITSFVQKISIDCQGNI